MDITRRRFLQYCGLSAAAIGLDFMDLGLLRRALANPAGPAVIWLHGSSCTGCSVSLLNRISDLPGEPPTVKEVLTDAINLVFHATLMSAAGDSAVSELKRVYEQGGYILVCEGGVPTAFNGAACIVYSSMARRSPTRRPCRISPRARRSSSALARALRSAVFPLPARTRPAWSASGS